MLGVARFFYVKPPTTCEKIAQIRVAQKVEGGSKSFEKQPKMRTGAASTSSPTAIWSPNLATPPMLAHGSRSASELRSRPLMPLPLAPRRAATTAASERQSTQSLR